MSWAERFAKRKESYARSRMLVARTGPLMIGAILVASGGFGVYSNTTLQIHGRPATATLMERIQECTVKYQRIGEEKRTEKWPCDLAEEFQRRVGSNKVKLSYDFISRVQFPLDGRIQEAKVDEFRLGSHKLPVGATLPVMYDPRNPADVRAEMSWERVKVPLGMFAVGLLFLALALGGPLATLYAWAFRGRTSGSGDGMVSPPERAGTFLATGSAPLAPGGTFLATSSSPPAPVGTFLTTSSAPRASFGRRK
jgi:hypothetical protein